MLGLINNFCDCILFADHHEVMCNLKGIIYLPRNLDDDNLIENAKKNSDSIDLQSFKKWG